MQQRAVTMAMVAGDYKPADEGILKSAIFKVFQHT
jgi:hypothetical protein